MSEKMDNTLTGSGVIDQHLAVQPSGVTGQTYGPVFLALRMSHSVVRHWYNHLGVSLMIAKLLSALQPSG